MGHLDAAMVACQWPSGGAQAADPGIADDPTVKGPNASSSGDNATVRGDGQYL